MRCDTEPPSTESLESQFYTLPVIESRSHVEVERGSTVWNKAFSGVEIDNITYAVTTPVDHPVVSVEWGSVPRTPIKR